MPIADRTILGRTIAEHIGGRWAISLIAFVINAPINLVGSLANVVDARGAPVDRWLLVWLASYASLGFVLLVANGTLFRNRRSCPVPAWWVVVLGAVAGGVRGAVAGELADVWQLSGGGFELVVVRTLTGSLLGAILIPAAALLLSVIASYSQQRKALLGELVELERERMHVEGESERLRTLLAADVEVNARALVDDESVRSARDMSHRLWDQAEREHAVGRMSIAWRSVVVDVFINYPYPGAAVAAIWAVSALGTLTVVIGYARGILQVLASVLVIWAAFRIARGIQPHWKTNRVLLLLATLAFVTVMTGPVASWIFDDRASAAGAGQVIANSIWLPALALIVGIIVAALNSSETVVARLTNAVRDEEIASLAASQERSRIQREMAEVLHGVQSRVFAARAQGVELDLGGIFEDLGETPHEQFEQLLNTWGLLMDLHVGPLPLELTDAQMGSINRVIAEGLSNAYRHGSATSCEIAVTLTSRGLEVLVRDDGDGRPARVQPGLGSHILDSACNGNWTLTNEDQRGALLHACITRY